VKLVFPVRRLIEAQDELVNPSASFAAEPL